MFLTQPPLSKVTYSLELEAVDLDPLDHTVWRDNADTKRKLWDTWREPDLGPDYRRLRKIYHCHQIARRAAYYAGWAYISSSDTDLRFKVSETGESESGMGHILFWHQDMRSLTSQFKAEWVVEIGIQIGGDGMDSDEDDQSEDETDEDD
jgi:hypothetical protein